MPGDLGAHGAGRHGDPIGARPRPGAANGFERAGGTVIKQRDSALPDPVPGADGGPIAAIEADNVGSFARDLRVLRAKAGLDYPDMAEKSHYTMRTLASAAGGLRLPTLPVLIAYVKACGGDLTEWEERWGKLMKATGNGQNALPAAPGQSAASGQNAAPGQNTGGQDAGDPGAGRQSTSRQSTSERDATGRDAAADGSAPADVPRASGHGRPAPGPVPAPPPGPARTPPKPDEVYVITSAPARDDRR